MCTFLSLGFFCSNTMTNDLNALDGMSNAAEYCNVRAHQLEVEIERMGIALGINWNNEIQVQALAKEALEHAQEALAQYAHDHNDYHQKAKIELFGLAAMMMNLMAEGAGKGIDTHGGTAWKALSKALMKERGMLT